MMDVAPSTILSTEGGSSSNGFPQKLMAVINDSFEDSIQWTANGSVVGIIPDKFSKTVLKTHFQGNKMDSFKRKLSRWGFQRVLNKQFQIAYHHPKFQQGKEELLASLAPRKQAKTTIPLSSNAPVRAGLTGAAVALGQESAKNGFSMRAEITRAFHPGVTHTAAAPHCAQSLLSAALRAREITRQVELARSNRILASTRSLPQPHQNLVEVIRGRSATALEELARLEGLQQASVFQRVRQLEEQDLLLRQRMRNHHIAPEHLLSFSTPLGMVPNHFQGAAQRFGLGSFLPHPATFGAASLVLTTQTSPVPRNLQRGPGSLLPAAASLLSQTRTLQNHQFSAFEQAPQNQLQNPQAMAEESSSHDMSFQDQKWKKMFKLLVAFRRTHGHCMVPQSDLSGDTTVTTTEEDSSSALQLQLARWVKRQRYQHKLLMEGNASNLTSERVTKLNQIGFCWDSHSATWAERLRELKEFKSTHGDCNVPASYARNPRLASWVKAQRRQHKLLRDGKESNMTVDRKAELDKIGFQWNIRVSSSADMRR